MLKQGLVRFVHYRTTGTGIGCILIIVFGMVLMNVCCSISIFLSEHDVVVIATVQLVPKLILPMSVRFFSRQNSFISSHYFTRNCFIFYE